MVSDIMFAIMPMFFTWKLRRPLTERALVSLLLALGFFATATVAIRLHYQIVYNSATNDTFHKMAVLFTWCRIEECLLIAAACTPFLKSSIDRFLARLSISTFKDTTGHLNSPHTGYIPNGRARNGSWKSGQSQDLQQVENVDAEMGQRE